MLTENPTDDFLGAAFITIRLRDQRMYLAGPE